MAELNKMKDLQAAYLCLKETVADDLESCSELKHVLQYAGLNPSSTFLEQYWKDEETERITFLEYSKIASELKPISEDYLKKLISSVFIVNNDKISIKDLRSLFTLSKKRKIVTDYDIDLLIEEVGSENGFIKVSSVSKAICHTINSLKKFSLESLEEKSHEQREQSKTYTKQQLYTRFQENKKLASSESTTNILASLQVDKWHSSYLKGSFFLDKDSIISHQYSLEIPCMGATLIKIKPVSYESSTATVDPLAYIFRESANGNRTYLGYTNLSGGDGSNYWMDTLKEGNYVIIPYASGLQLKQRDTSRSNTSEMEIALIEKTEKVTLTEECLKLLEEIFYQMDLDGNKLLNRQEFNLYNWRTSAEIVQDDEWEVVCSNFDIQDGELTLSGFISLHQLEAEDNDGDSEELWLSFETIGYNRLGQQDQAAPYLLEVYSQYSTSTILVSGLKSGGLLLDKALIRSVMEETEPSSICNMSDLIKYQFVGINRAMIVIQNKSNSNVRISVDCSQSTNCLSNRPNLNWTVDIDKKSAIIAHQLLRTVISQPWEIVSNEILIEI